VLDYLSNRLTIADMSSIAHLPESDYTIKVDVTPERARSGPEIEELRVRARRLEETFARLAPIVVERYAAKESQGFDKLVDLMLGDHRPTPIDIAKARMKAGALRAVFNGTEWLTAAQIAELAGLSQANRSGAANRWKQRRKVFALQHDGQDHYPRYLLDDDFRPLPAAEQVLGVLEGFSANRLASWFESRNGLLGGKRPRELLASDPERVIEAARRTLDAELNAA